MQMVELKRKKSMQSVDGINAKHVEKTELYSFVPEMKASFLSSQNRLIQFGQILDVHRLLAPLLLIEIEFVNEFPNPLELSQLRAADYGE
jgi:hypothetical protein